ncbi:hypothetical protein NDU88_000919 [Pleurodeles waltl]|uniref:Uncharacterized protein n=1 Tax=Pleurodeles waltl TaxID=8319 RepID=A0AAV7SY20_PLEWA|nr:hypothetical protein NDU88_000919 [Pleurodeles waltl]
MKKNPGASQRCAPPPGARQQGHQSKSRGYRRKTPGTDVRSHLSLGTPEPLVGHSETSDRLGVWDSEHAKGRQAKRPLDALVCGLQASPLCRLSSAAG